MDAAADKQARRAHRSIMVVNLGLVVNVLLALLKTAVGILGHSQALLADGINSTSDVIYYGIVRVYVGLARKPPDEEHPYGHRQLESIAAVVVGAFVLTTGVAILWDSINRVYDLWVGTVDYVGVSWAALGVALATVAVKLVLMVITTRAGRKANNAAVLALAQDHRNDVLAAGGVSMGILMSRLGYAWADPLAGALVALAVLRTGVEILRQSSSELMDTLPGPELRADITRVLESVPGVVQVEEVLAHRFGPYFVVNVTLGIPGQLSVIEGDAIATAAEQALLGTVPMVQRVHVHYHPVQQ